jgi:hypothetical protein
LVFFIKLLFFCHYEEQSDKAISALCHSEVAAGDRRISKQISLEILRCAQDNNKQVREIASSAALGDLSQ